MWTAVFIVIAPVALGVAIGLAPRLLRGSAKTIGPAFAFVALAIALLQLLPSAFAEIGPQALGFAIVCFCGAAVVQRVATQSAQRIGLGATLLGFLVHQIADSIQLGLAAALDLNLWSLAAPLSQCIRLP